MDIYDMSSREGEENLRNTVLADVMRLLKQLERKVDKIMIDIKHLTDSEQKLVAVVEQVLVLVGSQQAALKTLSAQLAAAIAAGDPVSNVALQASLDAMAKNLDDETTKVGNSLAAASPAAPTGSTGASSGTTPDPTPAAAGPVGITPTPPTGSSGATGAAPTGNTGSSPA